MKTKKELLAYLLSFITEHKRQKMQQVLSERTRHVTVVLEDIFQPHNASAVLRSCDLFGIQNVHIVENKYRFRSVPTVSLGSSKWLDVYKYNTVTGCIQTLKKNGYTIIATTPQKDASVLSDISISEKTALLFGTEKDGLTQEAMDLADGFVKIPMFGFTESFNISVSVALCLYQVSHTLRASTVNWRLSETEKEEILFSWVRRILKSAAVLEHNFYTSEKK